MIGRVILAFLAAVIVTEVAFSVVNTQSVLANLADLGIEIPLGTWFATMAEDVVGMATSVGLLVLVGFAIAFPVAFVVERFLLRGWALVGYPLAGAVAVFVILLGLQEIFGTHPVAASRTLLGTAALSAAGALGGLTFALLAGAGRADLSRASGTAA